MWKVALTISFIKFVPKFLRRNDGGKLKLLRLKTSCCEFWIVTKGGELNEHFLLDSVFVSFTWPNDAMSGWMQGMRCGEVWGSFPRSGDVDSRTVRMTCARSSTHCRTPLLLTARSPLIIRLLAGHLPAHFHVSAHASLISYYITCFVRSPRCFFKQAAHSWMGR